MRKFELNKDQNKIEPSKEQLQRHKDFSRLSHDYERLTKRSKKPLYRDPKLWMLLFIIALLMYLDFFESM
jgi:hypothetical protein